MPFTNPTPPAQSITIPTGATTGPRIVIGSTIPPELTAWAVINGFTITSVILEYSNTTDYKWEATGTDGGSPAVFSGTYNTTDLVTFFQRFDNASSDQAIIYGRSGIQSIQLIEFATPEVLVAADIGAFISIDGGFGGPAHPVTSSASSVSLVQTAPQSTISATFVNLSGATITGFQKAYTSTRIKITFMIDAFCSVGAGTVVELAVLINGTDYLVTRFLWNTTDHHAFGGVILVPAAGLVRGLYTIQGRWRRVSGGGTVQQSTDDYINLVAEEITA